MESYPSWYVVLVSAVVFPLLTGLLKRWGPAEETKRLVALAVSVLVAAGGLLLDGSLTWDTILPSWGLVYASGTVVYQVWSRGGSTMTKLIAPVVLVVLLVGCVSPPLQTTGEGPASAGGEARAETTKVMTTPATAFSQPGGTSSARSVTAGVERQNQNTAAGESIQGVIFPGTGAYMALMKADSVILSLSDRINKETAKEAPDGDLLTRLYAEFTANSDRIKKACEEMSPDFANLRTVTVMILVCKDNGAAEGETGDAQSQAVAEAMAKVVASTVGDPEP